jgi:hypothetical protein
VPRAASDASLAATIRQQPAESRAALPAGPDPKWRFFWRVGDRPRDTLYWELNAEPVVPAGGAGRQTDASSRGTCSAGRSTRSRWCLRVGQTGRQTDGSSHSQTAALPRIYAPEHAAQAHAQAERLAF